MNVQPSPYLGPMAAPDVFTYDVELVAAYNPRAQHRRRLGADYALIAIDEEGAEDDR